MLLLYGYNVVGYLITCLDLSDGFLALFFWPAVGIFLGFCIPYDTIQTLFTRGANFRFN